MKTKYIYIAIIVAIGLSQTSCEKVSPQGVLMGNTAVEDRVEMSYKYYRENNMEQKFNYDLVDFAEDGYSFLVGADSHITTDLGRMNEMFDIGLEHGDMFFCHLGDIADTKPDYYINLQNCISNAKAKYVEKYYYFDETTGEYYRKGAKYPLPSEYRDINFPFFPVVGNHDLTHNGWALWSNIFGSSFYEFGVYVGDDDNGKSIYDHFIFLDTASGTLGKLQVNLIEQGVLDGKEYLNYRHTFVFSHTNIFLPSFMQFASTFPREEAYFLLNQFDKWNADIVFCGHVHKFEERAYNAVVFLTLDSMSERNSPEPGDYLIRVTIDEDGFVDWEKVHMNYVAKK